MGRRVLSGEPTDRREALRRLGTGGLTALGAGLVGAVGGHRAASAAGDDDAGVSGGGDSYSGQAGRLSSELPVGAAAGPYGDDYSPPPDLEADALDSLTYPPAPRPRRVGSGSRTIEIEMGVVEMAHAVSRTVTVEAWTYNGSAPGPIIRATEGDLLRIRFTNRTNHDHNLHFHGRHSPLHDGWEPVPPGGESIYEITAGPAGVHPYHCHTMPIDRHIAKGLYGTLIVDPSGGRPPAKEVVLALSGWDVDDDGRNELYTWNGVAGFHRKYPIKVNTGEPVRAYVLNMVEYDPVASFHLHAEMFDVYPSGLGDAPALTADIISLGQMERAVVEFSLPERGRYMFHPHQHSMAARGAMGWFSAI